MKNYLIIGGSGFVGRAFAERVLSASKDNSVCIFSRNEFFQHSVKILLKPYLDRVGFFIGDVKDLEAVRKCVRITHADCIVVTSAIKRIEVCEDNPAESVLVNVIGIENVCKVAAESDSVQCVLYTSTDKAADPVGVYGHTKAISEAIMNRYAKQFPSIKFCTTRFANVLGSTGSVIPIYQNLIRHQQPLVVRGNKMTRFFLTQHQASQVMWDAIYSFGDIYSSGNVLIPKCKSFKIIELAEIMCEQNGFASSIVETESLSYEKIDEVLVSKSALGFKKCELDNYYILDIEKRKHHEEPEILSSDARVLLSKDELRNILLEQKII